MHDCPVYIQRPEYSRNQQTNTSTPISCSPNPSFRRLLKLQFSYSSRTPLPPPPPFHSHLFPINYQNFSVTLNARSTNTKASINTSTYVPITPQATTGLAYSVYMLKFIAPVNKFAQIKNAN